MQLPKKSKKINKTTTKTIILSLFISMIVGSAFGFLATLITFKHLSQNPSNSFFNGLFKNAEEKLKQLEKESRLIQDPSQAAVTKAAEDANPAVVSIIISKDVPVIERYFGNPFKDFEDFFGSFGFGTTPREGQKEQQDTQKQEIGGGTGFIISEDGYIITNKHVVSDTEAEYTVLTNDGKKYLAQAFDRDPVNDIAVLKIDPQNPQEGNGTEKLPYLKLGNSDDLKIGQTVIAIGNSLGEFRNTVSLGIVSGLRRSVTAGNSFGQAETLSELIQTDAAINQGNSGGPLLNLQGEVIGINVAKAAAAENIGFALPINAIKPIIESVKEEGKIIRPFLGIRYILNSKAIAEKNNLPYDYGAIIQKGESRDKLAVIPGSPADKAGIQENDIVLEIDGEKITSENNPLEAIIKKKPGDKIKLKIWSKGEVKDLVATLEERK